MPTSQFTSVATLAGQPGTATEVHMTEVEPVVFVVDEDATTGAMISRLAAVMDMRCEVFASGLEFLQAFERSQCGCLVTELKNTGLGGLQIQQRLASEGVTLPVIFATAHATLAIAVRAMRAGAFHFFEKPFSEQELWDAIHAAVTLHQSKKQAALHEERLKQRLASLSLKEEQVLRMIGEGKSNRMIAHDLDLSIRTIEIRRSAMMKKLGLSSPGELLQFALRAGNGVAPANPSNADQQDGRGFIDADSASGHRRIPAPMGMSDRTRRSFEPRTRLR